MLFLRLRASDHGGVYGEAEGGPEGFAIRSNDADMIR